MTTQPLAGFRLNKQRYLVRFESRDGSGSILFPRADHEWDSTQDLRMSQVKIIGADYGIDLAGHGLAPKDFGHETVRYVVFGDASVVDAELDDERSKLYGYGIGKLWSRDSTLGGSFRWCWARAGSMPSISIGVKDNNIVPVVVSFIRLSDWYAEDLTSINIHLSASPTDVSIGNSGNAIIQAITFTLSADAPGGFNGPKITNAITGEWFKISKIAESSNSVIRVITDEFRVEYSNDGGSTYTSVYNLLTMGPTQVGLMRFVTGTNTLSFTNDATLNADLSINYSLTYH